MNLKLETIKINNITLREFDCDDIKRLYEIGKNPNVCRYLNWGPYKNINEAILIAKEIFLKRPEEGIPIGYSIFYDNYMVGMIDYHTYKPVLFEFPTYEYFVTGESKGNCGKVN